MRTATTATVHLRAYRGPADHLSMIEISNAVRGAAGFVERLTVESMDVDYANLTNCDLPNDLRIAEIDGRAVGYGRVWWADRNSGERSFETFCPIHPDARRRGVGAALLAFQLDRIDELARAMRSAVAERPMIAASYTYGRDEGTLHLLGRHGFTIARRHAELTRPDFDDIPNLPLPNGLEIRPVNPDDRTSLRRSFDADAEVFRDHWGDVDDSDAAWRRWVDSPEIQPELWQVAFDEATGEIAGQILNYLAEGQDGRLVGWTEAIAVRRPYRRRGLARALLGASLRRVRDAGAAYAALGVDTENENRALDLYESLGFHIVAEQLELHRPVDPSGARR